MSMMSQNITDLKAVELRERKNMAGGLSTFERQAALTDPFTNIHERMALEGGTQARSSGPSSGGLSMPPPPSPSLPGVMPNREAMLGVLAPEGPRPVLSSFQQVSMPSLPSAPSAEGASESFQRSQISPSINLDPGLPGVMPNREAMLGVLGPEGPRPHVSNYQATGFQQVSMPPVPGGGGGDAFQSGGHLTSFHGGGGGDMFSGIGSSPLFGQSSQGQSSQGQSNAFENIASTLGEMSPGNLWNDVKRGVNPLLQFGKDMVKLVAGTVIAFVNFFFKPNTTK